jgi:hypothetical protein
MSADKNVLAMEPDQLAWRSGGGGGHAKEASINFVLQGGREMLRLSPDGFFVEGRKVTDDTEVYEAFKAWLAQVKQP